MIAGHFGFAAAVKSRAPRAPLWALMLASVFMDVVFVPLFVAGIEPITPLPGRPLGYGAGIIHADYTHSLVGALALSVVFGLVCAAFWQRRVALVLGAVVFSHWLLDLPMHRGDMPLLPGNAGGLPLLGFGLWRSVPASALLELALVVVGASLYTRAARRTAGASDASPLRLGLLVLACGVLTLGLNLAGL